MEVWVLIWVPLQLQSDPSGLLILSIALQNVMGAICKHLQLFERQACSLSICLVQLSN